MVKAYAFLGAAVAALFGGAALIAAMPKDIIPAGAVVEPSGFWSIATAPDSPPGPPMKPGPQNELTFYAQLAGVSNAEADKRMKAQEKARPEFERLMRTLRAKERGNYTDAELIHRPDWAYILYFKRQPAATLAKYTKNPRFQARSAPYTEGELNRMSKPWLDRLIGERLTTGYAMNPRRGTADIDMVVSAEEFDAIAKAKAWGPVPAFFDLKFGAAPVGSAVDSSVATGIRIFAQGDRNLGATNQAALGGRIVLKDGCLLVVGHDGKKQLAYFAREVGLGRDRQGYLSLHRRNAERTHLGRVGEMYTWAGPIGIDESAPMVRQLRAQCGKAPLMHVGIPESSNIFNMRYGLPRGPMPAPPPPPRRPGAPKVPG